MNRYEEGDHIYLFGFSRGAFTVRSLAGMLHKCGLLGRDDANLIEYASKIYNTPNNNEVAVGFKRTFSRSCPVHFIGVWDTVDSRLMNAGKKWADATLNPEVTFAYHAVSIDEKRKDFPPCLWKEENVNDDQTLEQVWFAGVHCDVGGWYEERGLSNTALIWMLSKAIACGIKLDSASLKLQDARCDPGTDIHKSYEGFWKFRGSRTRKIPQAARIHRSVETKIGLGKYKPKNLPDDPNFVD